MGKINVGRWIVGGVVAAAILFIVDFVVNAVVLGQQWNDAMKALGKPVMTENVASIALFACLNLLVGLTALWIYVGIRPRFGAGVTTAIYAGLATWLLAYLVPNMFILVIGLMPASLLWTGAIVGVIQVPVATVAGAYLYREQA